MLCYFNFSLISSHIWEESFSHTLL